MGYLSNKLAAVQEQVAVVAENTGVSLAPTSPASEPSVNARITQATAPLQASINQQANIINQQSQVIQQQQAALNAVPKLLSDALALNNTQFVTPAVQTAFQAIVGSTSAQGLYTLQEIMQHLAADETGATQLLAAQSADRTRFAALEPTVAGLGATLTTLSTTVGTKASASDVTAQKGRIDLLVNSTVPGLQTDIGNRLRKDQADATPYPLAVPVATGMDKAVQKSELVGGIQRPYRVFQNVGATPVGAYVRSGQVAAVSDGLALGQVYALTTVRLKTVAAPLVASIVKVYANGTEVYSTTVALATIAAVGKTLDLLALTGAALPADITLPATLTCTASAGTFEIILDGILK